jgi:hypothetical protein
MTARKTLVLQGKSPVAVVQNWSAKNVFHERTKIVSPDVVGVIKSRHQQGSNDDKGNQQR